MFELRPTQRRQKSQALVLVMILTVSSTAILRGDEVAKAATGEVRLGSGRVAGYTIHLDRNSLRDSLQGRGRPHRTDVFGRPAAFRAAGDPAGPGAHCQSRK